MSALNPAQAIVPPPIELAKPKRAPVGVFWWFALPFAALTLVFGVWPILLSLQVSFTESATALQPSPKFVGLANYVTAFTDPVFLASLWRTLLYTGLAVVATIGLALGYSLLLNSALIGRGRTLFKLAIFLPVVTPDIAGYVVWRWLYDQSFGALNVLLTTLNLPTFGGLASTSTVLVAVLIAELWHHVGFYVVIFLANLALCDKGTLEAAEIDGANTWQKFWHVTLPQLKPALMVNSVYALIQYLKTFTVVAVMTKGGPNDATNFVSYYAYQLFDQGRYGEATAMASILFAIVIVLALGLMRLQQSKGGGMNDHPNAGLKALAYAAAITVSLVCLYPYYWMLVSAFRSTEAILSSPLRPWPESLSLDVLGEIAQIGGTPLWRYAMNSVLITTASTALGIAVTALGAYAIVRRPDVGLFRALRMGFMLTIMYPYMLLVIPVYIVMYKIGLLGTYAGIILFLALGPIQFFLFEQFFRSVPRSVIEAAVIDGATEWQVLWHVVVPLALPVVATASIITFLLNWAQWLPVLVVSRSPDTYTLPVALMSLNGELGVNFQGIMALAVLTTIPVTIFFLIAQKRVISGMTAGAVKG